MPRTLVPCIAAVLLVVPQSASSQTERWSLVSDLRIGSAADPRQLLTSITDVRVDGEGNVYVVQRQDRNIRVFNPKGAPLRTIGRAGDGPGEFSDFMGPVGILEDTLWVSDRRLQRVTRFKLNGDFISSVRLLSPPVDGGFAPAVPIRMLSDGSALVHPGHPRALIGSGQKYRIPLLRVSADGELLNTILWVPAGGDQIAITKNGMRHVTTQPFADDPLLAVSPSGEVIVLVERSAATNSSEGTFRVTRFSTRGDTLYSKYYRYTPLPLPKAYIDSIMQFRATAMTRGARSPWRNPQEAERELKRVLYVPRMRVPITAAIAADNGSVWLMRENLGSERQNWLVLDRNGTVRAGLTTPRGASLKVIADSIAWAVERDDLDVPYLVRYRISRD